MSVSSVSIYTGTLADNGIIAATYWSMPQSPLPRRQTKPVPGRNSISIVPPRGSSSADVGIAGSDHRGRHDADQPSSRSARNEHRHRSSCERASHIDALSSRAGAAFASPQLQH